MVIILFCDRSETGVTCFVTEKKTVLGCETETGQAETSRNWLTCLRELRLIF